MSQRIVDQVAEVIARRLAYGDCNESVSVALNLLQQILQEDYPTVYKATTADGLHLAHQTMPKRLDRR